ncbi:uncharacterized protein M421DRAFT_364190 [Didymella exigua CBS 183.55]|uniref:HTH CENPB-type domain-containing protein n=1 Tax=Didymella exigua CBS 183.55 TaxID=1150837 RepID=A0A6A5RU53_9PLEO|nr:uncharacterized protein M421DRAFT_364190 [Didymella exigua CBS 183.55]KAF1931003.1 hypothetical protein M421DRAFT_364190 [Didymella exigua CBS 183.55]
MERRSKNVFREFCALRYSVRARDDRIRVTTEHQKLHLSSTRHNSTTMAPINDAIAAIKALKLGEKLVYQTFANKYSVNCVTLAQRHKRVQAPLEIKNLNRQKLTPQQEEKLVRYIEGLNSRHIPPTREMIANFASLVA